LERGRKTVMQIFPQISQKTQNISSSAQHILNSFHHSHPDSPRFQETHALSILGWFRDEIRGKSMHKENSNKIHTEKITVADQGLK
jgi:hypothetical protein